MPKNRGTTMPSIHNEYKAQVRNSLSLADRVEVIREFDKHGKKRTNQQLANKFQCGSKQIKNILENRESILELYNGRLALTTDEDSEQKTQEKIEFLSKVMYEYIQRVLYFNHNINDHKFRQKALQMKEYIGLDNFEPTKAWIEEFKSTYGIQGFELSSLRNNVVLTGNKRPYLGALDIIQYVRRMEQEELIGVIPRCPFTYKKHNNTKSDSDARLNSIDSIVDSEEELVLEIKEEDEEFQKLILNENPQPQQNSPSSTTKKCPTKRRASSPFFNEKHCNKNYSSTDIVSSPEPIVIVEIEEEEDEELQKLNVYTPTSPPQQSSPSTITAKITTKRRALSPVFDEEQRNISSPEPKAIIKIEDEELQKLNVCTPTPPPQQSSLPTITQKITLKRRPSSSSPLSNEEHCNTNYSLTDNISNPEPKPIIDIEDEELQKLKVYTPTSPPQQSSVSTTTQKITTKRQASLPFPDIESVEGALKHLKALEEYAMLQDNFRAVGLITQLDQIFQNQVKND